MLPSYIDSYFAPKRTHRLTKPEYQSIKKIVTEIRGLIRDEEALKQCEFPFLADMTEPIVVLALL